MYIPRAIEVRKRKAEFVRGDIAGYPAFCWNQAIFFGNPAKIAITYPANLIGTFDPFGMGGIKIIFNIRELWDVSADRFLFSYV